jgi:transposase
MKIEIVVEATGIPLGMVTDAASVSEIILGEVALVDIPATIAVPDSVPVIADRAYDSDPLRESMAADGYLLISPHRKNRVRPKTNDGRRLRRYKRRWIVERTFAWMHSYRRVVTRFEKRVDLYEGFVHLACAFIALNRLL